MAGEAESSAAGGGDAFAIATAAAHGAILLTGDPKITKRAVGCRVEDLTR